MSDGLEKGACSMRKPRMFTPEFKREVVAELLSGAARPADLIATVFLSLILFLSSI